MITGLSLGKDKKHIEESRLGWEEEMMNLILCMLNLKQVGVRQSEC